ncbi:MAG: PAS domain S-box protein, partial [Spirochaetaceae bacterium]
KGYPEGHVHLSRFMIVPVMNGDRIVAVAAVANRTCPYGDADVAQLSLFIHSVWRSIEARTSQDERLRLQNRFETVLETAAAGIILLDWNGRIVHSNRSALELFGTDWENMVGRHVSERDWTVIHPDGTVFAPDEFPSARTLATGEPCENVLMGVVRTDGETRWITATTRPIVDPGINRPDGVVISFADVTANETAAAALREREEFYRAVFQRNRAVKVLFDPETGRIEDINDAACAYYGYSREQMLTMVMWDINTLPRDELLQKMALSKAGKQMIFRFQHRLADGSIRDVEVFSGPVPMQGRTLIHAIIQDVTERVRAEQAVAGLLREKDLLLRETHHRVKNNMALVQSMLSIEASNAEDGHNTDTLTDAARRIQAMASLYDKLYRSEQHHQLDLAAYLPPLVTEIMALFPEHSQVSAEINVEPMVLPAKMLSSIGIIVNELITNSMKHAFSQPRVRTTNHAQDRISVEARHTANGAQLIYRDNGPGLSADFQTESETTFGFTLLNAMVSQIGGTLTTAKPPARGLEMVISFPLPAESR